MTKKYDRFTVNCSAIQLDTFKNISFILENTTDLVVANYHLQQLDGSTFVPFITEHDEDRERLIILALRRCGISRIYSIIILFPAPLHLGRLLYVDLSENALSEIRLDTSDTSFHNLTAISLAGNSIGRLQGSFFKSKQVRLINISNNGLWEVDPLAFYEVPNLEVLDLSRNELSRLPWNDISKLSSLKILALEDNPWVCSCDTQGIFKLKRSLLNGTGATCKYPSTLNGTLLKNLNSDSFIRCPRPLDIDIIKEHLAPYINFSSIIYCLLIYIIYYLSPIYKRSVTPLVPDTVPGIRTLKHIKFDVNAPLDKFGKVYRGSLLSDGQEAAIKKHPKIEVCQELRHCLHLNSNARPHPNIIRYLCVDDDTDFTYLALELCEGDLMTAIMKRINGFNPIVDPQDFISQLTSGICYLHENGIQHRDIKPQNILWKKTGTGIKSIKLIISDFDLSQFNEEQSQHNVKCGTKGWCPPELWNSGPRSYAVDIFPLGCVFYFILTRGLHPFGEITNLVEGQRQYQFTDAQRQLS